MHSSFASDGPCISSFDNFLDTSDKQIGTTHDKSSPLKTCFVLLPTVLQRSSPLIGEMTDQGDSR